MIAGSVTAASFLLMTFPSYWWAKVMYLISASSLGSALIMATMVVMPRLPTRTGLGSIFWGDIAMSSSASEYRDRFAKAAVAGLLDEEYSMLNFHTARILGRKIRILRGSIMAFLAGVLLAIPHHLINS